LKVRLPRIFARRGSSWAAAWQRFVKVAVSAVERRQPPLETALTAMR